MLCFCEAILGTQPLTLSFYCFLVAKNRIRALSPVDQAHWVYHRTMRARWGANGRAIGAFAQYIVH